MEKMCRVEKKYLKNAYIANTLVWMLILCLPYLSHGSDVSNLSFTDYLLLLRLPVTVIILFYVDYYFLVDRYLLKDRILPFIGINLILILFLLTLERMTAFPLKEAGAIRDFPDPPMVIFVSAFDRYAVDYLMKPVSYERFVAAVNKAYRQFSARASADATASGAQSPSQAQSQRTDFIFIKMESRLVKVYLTEILYIKGYGDYVKIYMTEGRVLLSLQSLNKLETLLPENFVRVHRSFIIALDKISEIEHRRIKIDQELIPIGESYLDRFFGLVLPQGREKP